MIGVLTLAGGVSASSSEGTRHARAGNDTAIGHSAMAAGFARLAIAPSLLGMSGAGLSAGIGVALATPIHHACLLRGVAPSQGVARGIMRSARSLRPVAALPLISQPVLGMVGYPALLAGTASLLLALAVICLMTLGQKAVIVPGSA